MRWAIKTCVVAWPRHRATAAHASGSSHPARPLRAHTRSNLGRSQYIRMVSKIMSAMAGQCRSRDQPTWGQICSVLFRTDPGHGPRRFIVAQITKLVYRIDMEPHLLYNTKCRDEVQVCKEASNQGCREKVCGREDWCDTTDTTPVHCSRRPSSRISYTAPIYLNRTPP